jgi:polysaccharide biosynthesis protein PslH
MKVLFLTPYLPSPPAFGGQRRIHGLMTGLAKKHDVSVISLVDATGNWEHAVKQTASYCRDVITVAKPMHGMAVGTKRWLQLRSVVRSHSWDRVLFSDPGLQTAIDQHLEHNLYDIICCEFVHMAGYDLGRARHASRPACIVLDEHNVEYDVGRRTPDDASLARRLFAAQNWRKIRREEHEAWARFDGCTLTSERDEHLVRHDVPGARTAVIPNGVDVDSFRPAQPAHTEGAGHDPPHLLFFGTLNYYPNIEGLLFFFREIWPLVRERNPNLGVRVVGQGPLDDFRAFESEKVRLVGFVDDLRPEIARASAVIAPLHIGGGTRLKILEAMSMGTPVVSTTVGAEGLDVEHDRHLLIGDSAPDFAHQIGRLIEQPDLGPRLGHAARTLVQERYSWASAVSKLEDFWAQIRAAGPRS